MAATPLASAERVQQSLCLLQIERVVSFREPFVHRRKQFARFTSSAHANPKACEARRRAKLLNPSAARSMPARWTGDDFSGLMATCTRAQTALRYVLRNPDLACAIIGLAEPAHLEEALAGQALGPLPQAALDQLDKLYATDFV
jgi:aryl-alcohol dehydrogenase-like predicted oxidoreductase